MIFQYSSFSRTFQESPSYSSIFQACVNPAIGATAITGRFCAKLKHWHFNLQHLIRLSLLYVNWPWNMNIDENVQLPIDCEMVTKYCATHSVL